MMKLCVQRCFRKSLMCFRCAPSTSLGLELCKRGASPHNDICLHNDDTVPLYTSGAPGQPGMALHELVCGCVGVWVCGCGCVCMSKVNCAVLSLLSLWMITHAAPLLSECIQMLLLSHLLNVLASYAAHLPDMVRTHLNNV